MQPGTIIKPSEFRIRCSSIGSIMAGNCGMTPAEQKELSGFVERLRLFEAGDSKKKLTDKMQDRYNELLIKSKQPAQLPPGAKTYVEKWVKENIVYRRRKLFGNKYTKKGNDNEDQGIELISKYFSLGEISKNKTRIFGEYTEGECDIELHKLIIDCKNSYTFDTFPVFDTYIKNSDYEGQLQGYMDLYNKEYALLCYVLTDSDESAIEKEAKSQAWILGLEEVNRELYEEVRATLTYSDLDIRTRIKVFRVERDREYMKEVYKRVELCREYATQLLSDFKNRVKEQRKLIN